MFCPLFYPPLFRYFHMKIKKTVNVKYSSSFAWSSLDITDTDGSEVVIELTDGQWLELEKAVKSKCDRVRESEDDKIRLLVNAEMLERKEREETAE